MFIKNSSKNYVNKWTKRLKTSPYLRAVCCNESSVYIRAASYFMKLLKSLHHLIPHYNIFEFSRQGKREEKHAHPVILNQYCRIRSWFIWTLFYIGHLLLICIIYDTTLFRGSKAKNFYRTFYKALVRFDYLSRSLEYTKHCIRCK